MFASFLPKHYYTDAHFKWLLVVSLNCLNSPCPYVQCKSFNSGMPDVLHSFLWVDSDTNKWQAKASLTTPGVIGVTHRPHLVQEVEYERQVPSSRLLVLTLWHNLTWPAVPFMCTLIFRSILVGNASNQFYQFLLLSFWWCCWQLRHDLILLRRFWFLLDSLMQTKRWHLLF